MRRKRLSKNANRRSYRKGATRVNRKNTRARPMRGGWRI